MRGSARPQNPLDRADRHSGTPRCRQRGHAWWPLSPKHNVLERLGSAQRHAVHEGDIQAGRVFTLLSTVPKPKGLVRPNRLPIAAKRHPRPMRHSHSPSFRPRRPTGCARRTASRVISIRYARPNRSTLAVLHLDVNGPVGPERTQHDQPHVACSSCSRETARPTRMNRRRRSDSWRRRRRPGPKPLYQLASNS